MATLHRPAQRGHACHLPTEGVRPLTLWDRGVGTIPGCRTHLQVKGLRYLLPLQYAGLRRTLAAEPKVLAAFDLEMEIAKGELADEPGDLVARLRRVGIEDGEQGIALAEYHARPTAETERALLRETLEEIGALQLLAAELKARIDARVTS